MARRRRTPPRDRILPKLDASDDETQTSLLDVLDNVLNKGVVLNGDVVLGVANVDLIYAKLSALLAAMDRVIEDPVVKPVAAGPLRRRRPKRPIPPAQRRK